MNKSTVEQAYKRDAEFLARSGITSYMKDVISILLEHRPEDPLEHIADYFSNVVHGVPAVTRAYRQIKLGHYTRSSFMDNVALAYSTMSVQKGSLGGKGVVGNDYAQLLGMLCSDFSPQASNTLLEKINFKDNEIVSFPAFHVGILTCLMYEEFIARMQALFVSLDVHGSGVLPRKSCDILMKRVSSAASG